MMTSKEREYIEKIRAAISDQTPTDDDRVIEDFARIDTMFEALLFFSPDANPQR